MSSSGAICRYPLLRIAGARVWRASRAEETESRVEPAPGPALALALAPAPALAPVPAATLPLKTEEKEPEPDTEHSGDAEQRRDEDEDEDLVEDIVDRESARATEPDGAPAPARERVRTSAICDCGIRISSLSCYLPVSLSTCPSFCARARALASASLPVCVAVCHTRADDEGPRPCEPLEIRSD